MKTSFRKISLLLATIISGVTSLFMTSCNSNDDFDDRVMLYNMVTVDQMSGTGMSFSFRTGETTPLINLTSSLSLGDAYGIKVGDRIMIGYYLPEGQAPDASGPIDLINFRLVYNDRVRTLTDNILSTWQGAQMYNTQVWRTGNYINAFSVIPVASPAVNICLYADPASINNGSMDLYLTLDNRNISPSQQGECYASYNLRTFFIKYPDVHTLNIHMAGPYDKGDVTFRDVYFIPGE